jgi:hypothetical protein
MTPHLFISALRSDTLIPRTNGRPVVAQAGNGSSLPSGDPAEGGRRARKSPANQPDCFECVRAERCITGPDQQRCLRRRASRHRKGGYKGVIALRAPCRFAKRGNEVRLILAPGAQNQSKPIPTLVRAVAQAKTWYWIRQRLPR